MALKSSPKPDVNRSGGAHAPSRVAVGALADRFCSVPSKLHKLSPGDVGALGEGLGDNERLGTFR